MYFLLQNVLLEVCNKVKLTVLVLSWNQGNKKLQQTAKKNMQVKDTRVSLTIFPSEF